MRTMVHIYLKHLFYSDAPQHLLGWLTVSYETLIEMSPKIWRFKILTKKLGYIVPYRILVICHKMKQRETLGTKLNLVC